MVIVVGICATPKKTIDNTDMMLILNRLDAYDELSVHIFTAEIIESCVNIWPICNVLISFYSKGFPLYKAIEYVKLRKPFMVNDLESQLVLFNRLSVLLLLTSNNIPTARYIVMMRDGDHDINQLVENDDSIVIDKECMMKPFVEKPLNGEDHNVRIYWKSGGCTSFFRKNQDRSFVLSNDSCIRRVGSFVYEEFWDGTSIKMYTVGQDYLHSETRPSCSSVRRDPDGKQIRRCFRATEEEKNAGKIITQVFKQNICGFDVIRHETRGFIVHDVNGWSFAKRNFRYYDRCAFGLRNIILDSVVGRDIIHRVPYISELNGAIQLPSTRSILHGIVALFRHGDRTPKRKLKLNTDSKLLFDLFPTDSNVSMLSFKSFDNIYPIISTLATENPNFTLVKNVLDAKKRSTRIQIKRKIGKTDLQFIIKWNGYLTNSGFFQVRDYASVFWKHLDIDVTSGFLNNMKVFCTTEGRVHDSARTFAAQSLILAGDLDSELVTPPFDNIDLNPGIIIKGDDVDSYLDIISDPIKDKLAICKGELKKFITKAAPPNAELDTDAIADKMTPWAKRTLRWLGDPLAKLEEFLRLLKEMYNKLLLLDPNLEFDDGGSLSMVLDRWNNSITAFYKDGEFNTTVIPDFFALIHYDVLHNPYIFNEEFCGDLFRMVQIFADFVTAQEYGISQEDKISIATDIGGVLVSKMMKQIESCLHSPSNSAFLYFSSESHLHALRNLIITSCIPKNSGIRLSVDAMELHYMTHVVMCILEDPTMTGPDRFYTSIALSPGATEDPFAFAIRGINELPVSRPIILNGRVPLSQLKDALTNPKPYYPQE